MRPLLFIALLAIALALGSNAQAQTMTIDNTSTQTIALNPFYAGTCTPPGTQQVSCITVAGGNSTTYTPPAGNVWYGFKIYCGSCTGSGVSISCPSGMASIVCGGTTIYISGDATITRIYQ